MFTAQSHTWWAHFNHFYTCCMQSDSLEFLLWVICIHSTCSVAKQCLHIYLRKCYNNILCLIGLYIPTDWVPDSRCIYQCRNPTQAYFLVHWLTAHVIHCDMCFTFDVPMAEMMFYDYTCFINALFCVCCSSGCMVGMKCISSIYFFITLLQ